MGLVWQKLMRPVMFGLDAERAHQLGIAALQLGLAAPFAAAEAATFGEIERFGLKFTNPLGVAAGFDKDGIIVNQLVSLGFGFVEVGTVTYDPQPGNPKLRLFRLPEDQALINRLGFNNEGARVVAERLGKLDRKCIIGVNIGKNKNVRNEEATENYLRSFELVHPAADYIAVNISSPNTPNLRELQKTDNLEELLVSLQARNTVLSSGLSRPHAQEHPSEGGATHKPLLIKIAPDLSEAEIEAIVDISIRYEIAGVIATNTTVSRDGLKADISGVGEGGLSGKPLEQRSNEVISSIFRYSKGKLPIIGVGGIFNAEDAFSKIAAGASLIQAYTGFIYGGPSFARDVTNGLAAILGERGFESLDQAVGSSAGA